MASKWQLAGALISEPVAPIEERYERPAAAAPSAGRYLSAFPAIALFYAAGACAALVTAGLWVYAPSLARPMVAVAVFGVVVVALSRDVAAGLGLLLVFLSVLALVRRLLIPDSAWTSQDALLLVGPLVIGLIVFDMVVRRGDLFAGRLEKLCAAFAVIAVLESFNPAQGGLSVGLGGLLFFVPPLLWFFAGTQTANRRAVEWLMYGTILVALLNAGYGTIQAEIGLPSWDKAWIEAVGQLQPITGPTGTAIRPFGSFSSPQEYLAVLAIGIVFSVGLFRRHPILVLTVPFLGAALFLGSGRGQFALTVLAIVVMIVLRVLRGRAVVIALVGAAALTVAVFVVASPFLDHTAASSSNPLVEHEASGLGNPFSQQSSTFSTHLSAFGQGLSDGVHHPLGEGTGISTIAADTLGSGAGRSLVTLNGAQESIRGTDTDVSNTFESFGLIGGAVYLAIIVMIGVRLLRRYSITRDDLLLAVIGLFVVMGFQWLRGGLYAVSGLTWFLFGWAARTIQPGLAREAGRTTAEPAPPRTARSTSAR